MIPARAQAVIRPIGVAVGVIFNALTVLGYALGALGVTAVPAPWLAALGISIGTVAFLVVIFDYHIRLEAKMRPHELADKITRMLLFKRQLDQRLVETLNDAPAAEAWMQEAETWAQNALTFIGAQRPNKTFPVLSALLDHQAGYGQIATALEEILAELRFD